MTLDIQGNIYIPDGSNHRIRKISTSGIITTIAGTGIAGYNGDNIPATSAQLNMPVVLTFDVINNMYIADYGNSRIRKVDTNGIITTIAGTGTQGFSGNNGVATSAMISSPDGLSFDVIGNLYIAEEFGNRIRKISTSGIITTIAGTGTAGYNGDNITATSAQLNEPAQLAFDTFGNLYIADELNNRIRKINTAGIITSISGTGTAGYSGDSGLAISAQLNIPFGIVIDGTNNIFFSDAWNNVIRKIDAFGIITTIVGNGFGAGTQCAGAYNGDNSSAILAELNNPGGIILDAIGNLYIADQCNNRIRRVSNVGQMGVKQFAVSSGQITVYPNPIQNSLQVTSDEQVREIEIYDVLGKEVISAKETEIDVSKLPNGIYFYQITNVKNAVIKTGKIIVQH